MSHTMIVPTAALENLRKAVGRFKERTQHPCIQPKFVEYLLANDPDELVDLAIRTYQDRILKIEVKREKILESDLTKMITEVGK